MSPSEAAPATPRVTFVIVSWNARDYLRECLETLRIATSAIASEVFVVDNASTDGSWELVRDKFPEVALIQNDQNLGFARANNQGIEIARGEYVCMLNSDIHVFPDTVEKVLRFMTEHPDVGLVGPRILNRDGTTQPSCRTLPSLRSSLMRALSLDTTFPRSHLFGGHFMTHWHYEGERDVEVLSGCFWFARRVAIDRVGPLDTRFFMYGEDIDFCRRFSAAGWRVRFFPGAEAIHYGGASSANAPARFWLEMQRANLQYWLKHHGATSSLVFYAILVLHHGIRAVAFGMRSAVSGSDERAVVNLSKNWRTLRWLLSPRTLLSFASGRVAR